MNCRQCEENISDYVAGRLDPMEAARLSNHCDSCARCAGALEREQAFRQLFSDAEPILHSPDLWSQVSMQLAPRKQRFGFPRLWQASSGFVLTAVAAATLFFTMFPKNAPPVHTGAPPSKQFASTPVPPDVSRVGQDESEYVYNNTRVAYQVGFALPEEGRH